MGLSPQPPCVFRFHFLPFYCTAAHYNLGAWNRLQLPSTANPTFVNFYFIFISGVLKQEIRTMMTTPMMPNCTRLLQ